MKITTLALLAAAGTPACLAQLETRTSIGTSTGGRPLELITLGAPAGEDGIGPDERPALLIVSGLSGQFTTGPRVAEALAARLASDHAEALSKFTVYVVPNLNPDLAAWHAEGAIAVDSARSLRAIDDDRDGRVDEDGPMDLNGDGVVTMMRLKNPPPGSEHRATLIADPKDPRVLREPDAMKGERAEYALLVEGRDQDGDGLIAEDPLGGVVFDRNFPARYPETEDGAGPFQLCEVETRAIVDWMLGRPNIICVMVYGEHDTLVNVPVSGQMDASGQVPLGIEDADKKYYEEVSKAFKEATKINECGKPDSAGAFHTWAYAHFGVFTFSTPAWARPDQMKQEEKKEGDAPKDAEAPKEGEPPTEGGEPRAGGDDTAFQNDMRARMAEFMTADEGRRAQMIREFENAPPEVQARIRSFITTNVPGGGAGAPAVLREGAGAQPEGPPPGGGGGPGGRRRGGGGPGGFGPGGGRAGGAGAAAAGGASGDDAKWLEYSDKQLAGAGFVPWTEFDHPDLGTVEIGGFRPGAKLNARDEDLPGIVDAQAAFVGSLLAKLPSLRVEPLVVTNLGGGAWRAAVRVTNDGFLPTRASIGVKARRLHPLIVTLGIPNERILEGGKIQNTPAIAGSGGMFEAEWTFMAAEGSEVLVEVRSAEFGVQTLSATLEGEVER